MASFADVIDIGLSMRILVVDDDHDTACSLQMLMGMTGHEARVAFDGAEALDATADFRPEVVVMNLSMPGMSGYQVARVLASDPARSAMTLIAFTGWQHAAAHTRALQAGFDACIVKPMDFEALRNLLVARVASSR